MDKRIDLVEQHVLESTARLRHIDELMARARTTRSRPETAARTEALLQRIEADRNRLAHELESLRRRPPGEGPDAVVRGEGLKGMLRTVGLELERALGAVFEQGR